MRYPPSWEPPPIPDREASPLAYHPLNRVEAQQIFVTAQIADWVLMRIHFKFSSSHSFVNSSRQCEALVRLEVIGHIAFCAIFLYDPVAAEQAYNRQGTTAIALPPNMQSRIRCGIAYGSTGQSRAVKCDS